MRIHKGYCGLPKEALHGAVAIGNFDGVHRGHRALIERTKREAARIGGPSGVITFEPHPREVLTPETAPRRLTPLRVKADLLKGLGVGHLLALPFNQSLRSKPPEAFVHDVLAGGLGVRHVVVGYDFRFGFRAAGDAGTLERLGQEYGFSVTTLQPVEWAGAVCSSTRIRTAIAEGEVGRAAELLGHPFVVEGRVASGDRRGRTLGYPTANLKPLGRNLLIPPAGVYAVRAGRRQSGALVYQDAVASLGYRPTFDGTSFLIEVHLFDAEVDLYGQRLACAFVERLRPEEKFATADALIAQMDRDALCARAILAARPA